jgi:hypothetical protein
MRKGGMQDDLVNDYYCSAVAGGGTATGILSALDTVNGPGAAALEP